MDLNFGLTIISLVSFLILLWVFNRYFFGPILNNVHMREHTIEKQLKDAAEAAQRAENNRDLSMELLKKSQAEATALLQQTRELAEKTRQDILEKAALDAAEILTNAQAKIEQESRRAFEELRSEVAALSLLTAEKMLSRAITDGDQLRLVNEVINSRSSAHAG